MKLIKRYCINRRYIKVFLKCKNRENKPYGGQNVNWPMAFVILKTGIKEQKYDKANLIWNGLLRICYL